LKILIFILFTSVVFPQKLIFNIPASVAGNIDYDNHFIDFFYGGRNIYDNTGITRNLRHSGFFFFEDTLFAIDSSWIDSTYHDAFRIRYNHGDIFPHYVNNQDTGRHSIFQYQGEYFSTDEEEAVATMGFWINRNDLNGNGLIFLTVQGESYILSASNVGIKGYSDNIWEVSKVIDNYSYLKIKLYNYKYANLYLFFRPSIYGNNPVTQLVIYNPTIIYSQNINPYKRYTSLAEKDTSVSRGKRILYVGDSQYNDGYFHKTLAEYTGAEIIDEHYGGYRMAYSPTSWFYQDTIKNKVFAVPNVDIYFFPISSNDNPGGNTRQSAIDSVKYFYPVYGDPPDTVTAKLARFNSLSESDKASIFGFQQTYSAYIEQIKALNPTARIILASVPIGAVQELWRVELIV